MANKVFANGREVSCKSASGKTICAFPDVCWSPPSPPAGPVPIPYPNTAFASDTTNGSKTVKISGKEVMLKDKSYFKKSTGDEPATRALGMGVITHTITGKVYFNSWSMDVKFEGENVDRHFDLTTDNHASQTGNTPPWAYTDRMASAEGLKSCDDEIKAVERNCKDSLVKDKNGVVRVGCPNSDKLEKTISNRKDLKKKYGEGKWSKRQNNNYSKALAKEKKEYEAYAKTVQNDPCQRSARCILSPWKPSMCCPPQTPHHLVEKASFFAGPVEDDRRRSGCGAYDENKALCVCAEGGKSVATHGLLHSTQADYLENHTGDWTLTNAIDSGARAMVEVFPNSGCSEKCIKAQLRRGHPGIHGDTKLSREKQKPKDINQFKTVWKKTSSSGAAD